MPAKRVLIVRLGAMGDVLHAMPAVAALRAEFPEWYLGWVIEPRWAPLLQVDGAAQPRSDAMPLVDAVHTAHARGWARAPLSPQTWTAMRALRRELRAGRYDLCIDLQGAVRSAMIGRMAGTRLIGEAEPRERIARLLFAERVPTRGVHVIEQALEVVEAAVGRALPLTEPPLPRSEDAECWVEQHVGAARPLVLINPGAGWGAKRWPAERYGSVARQLAAKGVKVIVNAGPGEEAIAAEVRVASANTACDLALTLDQLIAVTRRASLVIAGDTGPLHLACALGKPVVGIFGPTDPARNGPFGVPFRVLRHPESKRDHSRRDEPEAGLLTISSDAVAEAAEELLHATAVRA